MEGDLPERLKTQAEYEAAVQELDRLLDEEFEPGSAGEARLDRLAKLVTDYEDQNSPMPGEES